MSTNIPLIHAQGLGRQYQEGTKVLNHVDLRVEPGEMIALLGESGSGKSTLLSILGALDNHYEGWVSVCGVDLRPLRDAERTRLRNNKLGFIFQAYNLLGHLNALQNVSLPAVFADTTKGADTTHATALLERVGLEGKAQRYPHELSGGERQRVAIARALYHNPEVLLCDEPTGNLDKRTGGRIVELLYALRNDGGKRAILVATHDPSVAKLADKVLALNDGVLVDYHTSQTDGEERLWV